MSEPPRADNLVIAEGGYTMEKDGVVYSFDLLLVPASQLDGGAAECLHRFGYRFSRLRELHQTLERLAQSNPDGDGGGPGRRAPLAFPSRHIFSNMKSNEANVSMRLGENKRGL